MEYDAGKCLGDGLFLRKGSVARVRHCGGNGEFERLAADVGDAPSEKRHGHAARLLVALDQRIHRLKRDGDGHRCVGKLDLRERVCGLEDRRGEARIAVVRRQAAKGALVERLVDWSLKEPCRDLAVEILRAHNECGVDAGTARDELRLRRVSYLKGHEASVAAKRDLPRADAANGHLYAA